MHTRPDAANGRRARLQLPALFTRPLIGGGFISALSVPLIAALGLSVFTILALVTTVGLAVWGMRRAAVGGRAAP